MSLEPESGEHRPPVERRSAVRFPIDQQARYKTSSRRAVETGAGRTVNISSSGVLFTTERPLAPGERLELSMNWPAQLDHKHPLKLVAAGRVIRASNGTAAIVIERYEFRTQGASRLNSQ
jgi:c-di-GMP-binding flagellar brake protein YcgR